MQNIKTAMSSFDGVPKGEPLSDLVDVSPIHLPLPKHSGGDVGLQGGQCRLSYFHRITLIGVLGVSKNLKLHRLTKLIKQK